MTVRTKDMLMALGEAQFDLPYSEELRAEFIGADGQSLNRVILLYRDGRPVSAWVAVEVKPTRQGITLACVGPEWYLGTDEDGPLIEEQLFLTNHNKHQNGDFSLDWQFWTRPEITMWTLKKGTAGNYVITAPIPVDPFSPMLPDDDVLRSEEQIKVRDGELWETRMQVSASPSTQFRLRIAHVFSSKQPFSHPNLMRPYSEWLPPARNDITVATDPDGLIEGPVLRVETAMERYIDNPSFKNALAGWMAESGHWTVNPGPDGEVVNPTPGIDPVARLVTPFISIAPTQEYLVEGWANHSADADGKSAIYARIVHKPGTNKPDVPIDVLRFSADGDERWRYEQRVIHVNDEMLSLTPVLEVEDFTVGGKAFDNVQVTRTRGNADFKSSPVIPLVPKRTYDYKIRYRSTPGTTGTVTMRAVCSAINRPIEVITGPTLQPTDGNVNFHTWPFAAPGGYDYVQFQFFSMDVYGGVFYIGQGTLTYSDEYSFVREVRTEHPLPVGWNDWLVCPTYVPKGADTLRVDIVAEPGAVGWLAGDVQTRRLGVTPPTGNSVVRNLLKSRHTNTMLLQPGTIHSTPQIAADWEILNMYHRQAIKHLSRSGLVPGVYREWRIRIDDFLRLLFDWGTGEQLFRETGLVFGPNEARLDGPPDVTSGDRRAVSNIKVIGATTPEGNQVIGRRGVLYGTERFPPGDFYGHPAFRYAVVNDSLADHPTIANAVAEYHFQRTRPRVHATAKLSGPQALEPFDAGDWLDFFNPESGLVDPSRERRLPTGEMVNPKKFRVLSKAREHSAGSGHALYLHRPRQTPLPLSPIWSKSDTVEVDLSDQFIEFGGQGGREFARWWSSTRPPSSR